MLRGGATAGECPLDDGQEGDDDLRRLIRARADTIYHPVGACRMGSDPRTSVVNAQCRTHDVPNLYVVDGSFMPTSGGAAPTLTILANSLRTADHIVARAHAGDL